MTKKADEWHNLVVNIANGTIELTHPISMDDITHAAELAQKMGAGVKRPRKPLRECIVGYMSEHSRIRVKSQGEARSILERYASWAELNNKDIWSQDSAIEYKAHLQRPGAEGKALDPLTLNKHLTRLSSLLKWCMRHNGVARDIFEGLKVPLPKKRASASTPALTHAELERLLAAVDPASDSRHWVVLLGIYAGAHPNEFASLHLKDVQEADGVPFIHFIEDSPEKRGQKTVNGERVVPLHNELIRRGFLEHVARLRLAGETRLFPMWPTGNRNGAWHAGYRWYDKWKAPLGIKKTYRSFRHTFETGIRDAGVSETLAAELAGHSPGTTQSYGRYAKTGNIKNLHEAINKMPINPGRRA